MVCALSNDLDQLQAAAPTGLHLSPDIARGLEALRAQNCPVLGCGAELVEVYTAEWPGLTDDQHCRVQQVFAYHCQPGLARIYLFSRDDKQRVRKILEQSARVRALMC